MAFNKKLAIVFQVIILLLLLHLCVIVYAHYDLARLFGALCCVVIEVLEILIFTVSLLI